MEIIPLEGLERGVIRMLERLSRRLLIAGLIGMGVTMLSGRRRVPLRRRFMLVAENALMGVARGISGRLTRVRV
jgi:hypothetical protein